jgi:hypothetical protein
LNLKKKVKFLLRKDNRWFRFWPIGGSNPPSSRKFDQVDQTGGRQGDFVLDGPLADGDHHADSDFLFLDAAGGSHDFRQHKCLENVSQFDRIHLVLILPKRHHAMLACFLYGIADGIIRKLFTEG